MFIALYLCNYLIFVLRSCNFTEFLNLKLFAGISMSVKIPSPFGCKITRFILSFLYLKLGNI